jgi:hypothetical protein
MSRELNKFAACLKASDQMMEEASKQEIAETARVLAIELALYRARFGEMSAIAYEMVTAESISDAQASTMADGCEVLMKTMFILRSPSELIH